MRKQITKLTAIVTLMMFLMMSLFQTAIAATKEDYKTTNEDQKDYYTNVYVPAYYAYNQALRDFRDRVYATDFETVEQAERVLDLLNDLKQRRFEFFGNRETVGKSRYEVPRVRAAMYAAAQAGQYDQAITLCRQLKQLVIARVNFLNGLAAEVEDFNIIDDGRPTTTTTTTATTTTKTTTTQTTIQTTTSTATTTTTTYTPASEVGIVFHANAVWSEYSFGFQITVTNNTNQDISNWTMEFAIDGATINGVWIDGGSLNYQMRNGGTFHVQPYNQHQSGYTIPANSSMMISGNANGNANRVSLSNATFNGRPATISYVQ